MELFSSVKNAGAFTLCFMRSFRRRIAVGSLAGALLFGLAHYCLADALLFGLAHYCLGWRTTAWPAHCCLASVLQRGSARGGAGSLLQSAQCGVAVALASDYSVGASSCSKRSRV